MSEFPPIRNVRLAAFTLTECLVTILILASVLMLLLPAISRSRASSEKVICVGNLRKLGTAIQAYATEHDGSLPPASLGSVGTLEELLTPYVGPWVDASRLIANDTFYCPTSVRLGSPPKNGYLTRADGKPYYKGWGGYMIGYRINASVHRVIGTGDPTPPLKISQVQNPAKTFSLTDTNTRSSNAGGPPTGAYPNSNYLNTNHPNSAAFGDVHSGWCNILFLDGHVQAFTRDRPFPIISLPGQQDPWFP